MSPPPPPPEGRAGSICVYLVSCLLFLAIVTGGAFFVLYITLPESEDTIWFPIAGLALVGMPWLFWTTTCLYRAVTPRPAAPSRGGPDRAPGRVAAAVPPAAVAATAADDAQVDSPGGRGRVRFGAVTVMDGSQEVPGGGGGGDRGGCSSDMASRKAEGGEGDSHATNRSSGSHEDGSLTSHDSDMPLFRAH